MFTEAEVASSEERVASPLATPRAPSLAAFLDELLADQQRLQTPVARFGALDHSTLRTPHSAIHTDLIPLTAPAAGEQYAFEVDLDRCSGCKACVAGCHSLNGLDETETWRDVGLLIGNDRSRPFQQTVTTACHHCADPGCLNGCPVLAYEKDPVTGIVRHLDDQCIGCQYCVLKCPYDVPKYNDRLGIVRKCDMCHQRLAVGEAPACVQACPTEAIRITKVRVESPASVAASLLPNTPDSKWTRPTTRYVSRRALPPDLVAADAARLQPQHAHMPLVLLLVLTQTSVGLLFAHALTAPPGALMAALVCAGVGLAASAAHLGQPLRAWRVFLNLRRSWLSREAVVFGGYAAFAATTLLVDSAMLCWSAVATGLLGVVCSIMIYADTPRTFWRWPQSSGRMSGTVAVAVLALLHPAAAALVLAGKLALEAATLLGTGASARLQRGPLRALAIARLALGGLAAGMLLAFPGWAALAVWLAGELAERRLFFRAVDHPRMPGVPA